MKQVIVVRSDLRLSKGKLAAQAAHGAVSAFTESGVKGKSWLREGQKKVVLKCKDLAHLKQLKEKCDALGIKSVLISDAGLTEIKKGTITVLAIGPDKEERINKVTGSLPLLK